MIAQVSLIGVALVKAGGEGIASFQVEILRQDLDDPPRGRLGRPSDRQASRQQPPTWDRRIALLGSEPRPKLCSTASQLARPKEYADLAMRTIGLFGEDIWSTKPRRYWKYAIGAVSYYLLAADRKAAIAAALSLKRGPGIATLALGD